METLPSLTVPCNVVLMLHRSAVFVALVLLGSAVAVPFMAPTAQAAQVYPILCGVKMVLRNPSLQIPQGVAESQQYVRANGTFFIQIQVIDNPEYTTFKASDVTAIGFHFGAANPDALDTLHKRGCDISGNNPPWQPLNFNGEALRNYRIDNTPGDGFFIPIITTLVPDGWYIAGASAFNSAGVEIGRYLALAKVDNWNGCDETNYPTSQECTPKSDGTHDKDSTAPWPWVLPGDDGQGRTDNPHGVNGFTIEVADNEEYIGDNVRAWIAKPGQEEVEVTGSLAKWDAPLRDNDAIPCLLINDALKPVCDGGHPSNPTSSQNGKRWPAWKYETDIPEGSIFRVQIIDTWGNAAEKTVHIGNPQAGAAVGAAKPDLKISAVDRSEKTGQTGAKTSFLFTYFNEGQADAHTDLLGEGPEGWKVQYEFPHIVVRPGETFDVALNVDVPTDAQDGSHQVKGIARFVVEGREVPLVKDLTVVVGQASTQDGGEGEGEPDLGTQGGSQNNTTADTPGPGIGLVMVSFTALGLAIARSRRGRQE